MAAYAVVSYDVTGPEKFGPYVPAVQPVLRKYNAEILAARPALQVLEGSASMINVVLKFPSQQAALNWYNDPEYAPLLKLRLDTTSAHHMILLGEFQPPA